MIQLLKIENLSDARYELNKIKVSSQGVEVMSPKLIQLTIKIKNMKVGGANIIKQEMLSIGGDAAVARGVVEGSITYSDVILMGNLDKMKKLCKKLVYQPIFGLKVVREKILELIKEIETEKKSLEIAGKILDLTKTNIMGILNVTPDSFSDGNDFFDPQIAVQRALEMEKEGATIIDIGGESTKPGADPVSESDELKRVIPIIKSIRKNSDVLISIDTYKSSVAREAVLAGANIINDISAMQFDSKMVQILKEFPQVIVILMHIQGTPKDMQKNPHYDDTIYEILSFFEERINFCIDNGIELNRIIIDPGIGFGKRHKDNLLILKKLKEFKTFGCPVLLGASRKSFINKIYPSLPKERLEGTLATTAQAFYNNIEFVRVHDVKENVRFLQTLNEIRKSNDLFTT